MIPVIWHRSSIAEEKEIEIANKYFKCVDSRVKINKDDYVICRYSALPFFKEQAYDLEECIGAKLINSPKMHYYVADCGNWIQDLEGDTPKTWYNLQDVPKDEPGSLVLKGGTNSRKFDWNSLMFSPTRKEVDEIYWRLCKDTLLMDTEQNIYIRKYEPLMNLMTGINDLPISKEFRIFVAFGEILSMGFYWSNYIDDIPNPPEVSEIPLDWLYPIIKKIGNKINFYTIDVAQKQDGSWLVIELNDGTMSGLSCNNADTLYRNLRKIILAKGIAKHCENCAWRGGWTEMTPDDPNYGKTIDCPECEGTGLV